MTKQATSYGQVEVFMEKYMTLHERVAERTWMIMRLHTCESALSANSYIFWELQLDPICLALQ